jgi:hypothetical protein
MERADRGNVQPGKTTTHAIVARDADVAIVLRRGPTRHVRLLTWDLRDDTVRGGQWLVGTVHFGACGVSPDGELFVYSARKGGRTFTCVSRPPYFTALAFWEAQLPWTGGGFFVANDHAVLGVTHAPNEGSLPPRFSVSSVWSYLPWSGNKARPSPDTFGEAVLRAPEARQHWQVAGRRYRKPNPRDPSLVLERNESPGRAGPCRLVQSTGSTEAVARELGTLDWADWARDGTLVFGAAGRLHRQHVRGERAVGSPAPVLVADLTTQVFEPIVAPEAARQWPRVLLVPGKKR